MRMDPAALTTTVVDITVSHLVSPQSVLPINSSNPVNDDFPHVVPYIPPSMPTNEEMIVECDGGLFP